MEFQYPLTVVAENSLVICRTTSEIREQMANQLYVYLNHSVNKQDEFSTAAA